MFLMIVFCEADESVLEAVSRSGSVAYMALPFVVSAEVGLWIGVEGFAWRAVIGS